MKYILIILLLAINLVAQNIDQIPDTIQTFKNNSSNEIIEAGRKIYEAKNRVIKYIDSGDFDSLSLFIKYCDSITFHDDNWLSQKERFFIELFIGNIEFLKNSENYNTFLELRDTIAYYKPGVYKLLYHEQNVIDSTSTIQPKINLLDYLLLSFRDRIKTLKEKYTGYEYVWDFLDFIYNKEMNTIDYMNAKAVEYYKKYPDSPLLNYVKYNFLYKEVKLKRGFKFGVGYGWFGFDNNTRNLFKPRGNLSIWIDTYWSGIYISFTMYRGYSLQTNSDIILGDKFIPKHSSFYQGIESLTTGYLFRLNDNFDITPYAGFAFTETQDGDDKFKSLYAWQAGFRTDFLIESHEESELFIAGDLMIRFEAGILLNDYSRIRRDLGGSSYYASIGILFSTFKKNYDYSF